MSAAQQLDTAQIETVSPDTPARVISDPSSVAPGLAPAPVEQSAEADAPEASELLQPPSYSARDKIAAKFRAKQKAHDDQYRELDDPAFVPPFIKKQYEQDEPGAQDAPVEQPPTDQTFTIKVRGVESQATRAQLIELAELSPEEAEGLPNSVLIRSAQLVEAGKTYLTHRRQKDFLASQPAASEAPPTTEVFQQPVAVEPQTPKKSAPDFKEAIEKIQYGDPDEASAVFAETVNAILDGRDAQTRANQMQATIDGQIEGFTQSNADLFQSDPSTKLFVAETVDLMLKEIAQAFGADPKDLARFQTNPTFVRDAYREALLKGAKVAAPSAIMERAGKVVRDVFKIPEPGAGSQPTTQAQQPAVNPRVAAKRALPQQPNRLGGSVAQTGSPVPQPTRSSVVMQMRQGRGQSV